MRSIRLDPYVANVTYSKRPAWDGSRTTFSPKVRETRPIHSVFISSCVGRRTAEIVMEGSYFAFFADAHDIHLVFIIAAAGRNVTSLYIDRIIHLHVISVSTYGPQSVAFLRDGKHTALPSLPGDPAPPELERRCARMGAHSVACYAPRSVNVDLHRSKPSVHRYLLH